VDLQRRATSVMEAHWRPQGFTCPNHETYPWQWLWDSCFHSIVWAALGDERALVELGTIFDGQDAATGFVPHMTYWQDPRHADFWGRERHSSITQPPMYGHAVRSLVDRGLDVPPAVVDSAARGLWFLLRDRRRSPAGLVQLAHPWESGADDSPRWDDLAGGPFELQRWYRRKGELVASIERNFCGAPIANREAPVASVAFAALVAFNARELASVTGDGALDAAGVELGQAVAARWYDERLTWADDGPTANGSGRARTLEGLLGVLVDDDRGHEESAFASLLDPRAHGAPYGPTGVHRSEPTFEPSTYWRGPAWPQLTYLLWVAAHRRGRDDVAQRLGWALRAGAARSDFAEYWHPDTGEGLGAVPQSWTALAVVTNVDRA
jgi:hypothetical protein